MKLLRPHIPLDVKLQVAARQLCQGNGLACVLSVMASRWTKQAKLDWMLHVLFGAGPVHLDHDPPLALRYYNERTGKYRPPANDPMHLVYRTAKEHEVKTRVRGDHGQFADLALIRREKRRVKQAKRSQAENSKAQLSVAKQSKPSKVAGRKWPATNRWPPKGSRPLGRRK